MSDRGGIPVVGMQTKVQVQLAYQSAQKKRGIERMR